MSATMNTTARQIWKKLENKEYRDSFVSSNISNTVSSQIYTLRDQRGWTQKELAQRAGMGQSRIPALEDPNLDNFEVGTLKRIASAFDVALVVRFVPFSELVGWTAGLSEENLAVQDFANDTLLPVSANTLSVQIVHVNVTGHSKSNPAYAGQYGGNVSGGIFYGGGGNSVTASMTGGLLTTTIAENRTIYSQQTGPNSTPSMTTTVQPRQGDYARG